MLFTLGQLFLLRRDIKTEISQLESELNGLACWREDAESLEQKFTEIYNELMDKRKVLDKYDTAILTLNNKEKVITFENEEMSLTHARTLKVKMEGRLGFLNSLVTRTLSQERRKDQELVWDRTVTPPVQEYKKIGYVIHPAIPTLKQVVKAYKQQIGLLDSLIQSADWQLTIELPE